MAWELSHTEEGLDNAYKNLRRLSRSVLEEIWAENDSAELDQYYNAEFDTDKYAASMVVAKTLPSDVLVDAIWEKASEEIRTTDNGGWNMYMCYYGCCPHTVTFDPFVWPHDPNTPRLTKKRRRRL